MELYIDGADVKAIEKLVALYPCDGVTTNPSILASTGNPDPMDQLRQIREVIGEDRYVIAQAVSRETDDMVCEAHHMMASLGKKTLVKLPVTGAGLKAIQILAADGIDVVATAVYGVMPGLLAAKAGARYLAPYVNRLDMMGYDGMDIAKRLHTAVKASGYDAKVLGASFKNAQQVIELALHGVESVTVAPDVFEKMAGSVVINSAVGDFIADFEGCCGAGKTMLDF